MLLAKSVDALTENMGTGTQVIGKQAYPKMAQNPTIGLQLRQSAFAEPLVTRPR
jgi:hypothetical protein